MLSSRGLVWHKHLSSPQLTADWTSYDKMGRTATQWECTPLNCGSSSIQLGYTYDLAGGQTSFIFNGGGYTISQSRDGVDRATGLTSSIVDANHPATLLTVDPSVGYWPTGALRKLQFGNGLYQTAAYNKRLQPCRMNTNSTSTYTLTQCSDAIPSGNVLDFNCGFNLGSSDNGNVASWTATGQQAFSRSFTYDSLNRISTLNQSSGNATGCSSTFSLSWTIDPWGNRTDQTVTAGTCNPFHATVNTQNQLIDPLHNAYTYDSAGNMTADGSHTYFYDAENRLSQVDGSANYCTSHSGTPATACYVYDALGRRAEKNVGGHPTDFIYDAWGNVSNELNTVCAPVCIDTDYLYLDGQLVAEYKEGLTYFVHLDHLGSTRLVTNYPWVSQSQSVAQNLDYLPFGELNSTDSGTSTHKFTGKERDSESGNDNFGARYDSSSIGRFMSADQLGPGQHPGNPQTWNLYSYVLNNPLKLVDPTGEFTCDAKTVSDQQCDNLQAALDKAQEAADKLGETKGWDSKEYLAAQRAIDSYGDEGVDNGVVIAQGNTGNFAASTDPAGKAFPGEKLVVTFNTGNLDGRTDNLAVLAGHEGSHVADDMNWLTHGQSDSKWAGLGLSPGLLHTAYEFEQRGYSVGNSIAEGLGAPSVKYSFKDRTYNFPIPLTPAGQDRMEIMIKREYPNWNLSIFKSNTKPQR